MPIWKQELEDVLRRQAMDKGELLQCVNDLEAIAAKRQQKVLQLEAQLRELMYSGKKKGKQVADAPHDVDQESDADADDTLMEDLLVQLRLVFPGRFVGAGTRSRSRTAYLLV